MRQGVWRLFAAAGVAAVAAYYLVPAGTAATLVYQAIGVATVAAMAAGARLVASDRTTWYLLAAAIGGFVAGDGVFAGYEIALAHDPPFPSAADALYLAAYVLLAVAVVRVSRGAARPAVGDLLDAAFVTIAGTLVLWLFVFEPLASSAGSPLRAAVAFAYPTADVLLLALTAHALFTGPNDQRARQLLVASFALLLASDAVYGRLEPTGAYRDYGWLDAGWLLSYVLAGAAALHPSAGELGDERVRAARLSTRRAVAVACALLTAPLAMVAQQVFLHRIEVFDTALAMSLLAVVAVARLGIVFRDQRLAHAALLDSDRRYRTLIEKAVDVISIVDVEGRIVYQSAAAADVLGRDVGEVVGTNVFELIHPDDRAPASQLFAQLIAGDEAVPRDLELRVLRPDGSHRVVAGTARRLLADPSIRGIVVNWRDVTDERAAQALLQQQEERLRQAERLEGVGRLAGGVAHDFNNLLTAINGYAEIALRSFGDDDPNRRAIEEVIAVGGRAGRLTRQLLTFASKRVAAEATVDVREIATEISGMLARLVPETIALETHVADEPVLVYADRGQLEQILVNLAVNARDAMPHGGTLAISVARDVPPDCVDVLGRGAEHALIRVVDTGVGMSDDVERHAFDPFFTTKPVGEGTGLGLATVYGAARRAGGGVAVETEPGRGSTFSVYLPLTAPETPELEPGCCTDAAGTPPARTILLVEDEPVVRSVTREMIEGAGHTVVEAANGRAALELLDAGAAVDAIVTDTVMPELGGIELAREVTRRALAVPVVLVSGYVGDAVDTDELAATVFLQKPYTTSALLETLESVSA